MNALTRNPHGDIESVERKANWPTRVADLSEPEMLVLGAYRHWLTGLEQSRTVHFEIVSREFRQALGEADGRVAFSTFAAMVRILARGARRSVRFHKPCCGELGLDETQVVCMVSACQHGRLLLARSISEWMVEPSSAGDLLGRLSLLGSMMANHGLTLPDRVSMHAVSGSVGLSYIDTVH